MNPEPGSFPSVPLLGNRCFMALQNARPSWQGPLRVLFPLLHLSLAFYVCLSICSGPLGCGFAFCVSSYLWSQQSENIKWEMTERIYFLSFKLHNSPNTMMESHDILLEPAQDMNHLLAPVYTHYIHYPPDSHLVSMSYPVNYHSISVLMRK